MQQIYECSLSDPLRPATAASCLELDSEGAYIRTRTVYKHSKNPLEVKRQLRSSQDLLAFLFNSLADRETTKVDDESICLATLMDFQLMTFSRQMEIKK
jgi:hypothetical protein